MWFLNPFILIPMLLMLALAVGVFFWIAVLVVGLWKRKSWVKWTGGIGIATSLLLLVLVGGCYNRMWSPEENPRKTFASAFGKTPPAGITNIVGIAGGFADSGSIYVQFQTDEATFRSLLPQALKPVGFAEWVSLSWLFHPPEWWAPVQEGDVQLFLHRHDAEKSKAAGPRGFWSEATVMTWNPKTGLVQYGWSGAD